MIARVADAAGAAVALGERAEGKREIGRRADGEETPLVIRPSVRREEIREDPCGMRLSVPPQMKKRLLVVERIPAKTYQTQDSAMLYRIVVHETPLRRPRAMITTGKETTQ